MKLSFDSFGEVFAIFKAVKVKLGIVHTTEHMEEAVSLLLLCLFISSIVFLLKLRFHSKFVKKIKIWGRRKFCCCRQKKKVSFNG